MVTSEPENVDKQGQLVKVSNKEELPYEDLEELQPLNAIKVCHVQVDDPNIVLYVQEIDNYQSCYFTKKLESSTMKMEKVL